MRLPATPGSLDARAPEQTRLSARRNRYAKKNAAPDRRAHETSLGSRPETQNRMGPIRRPALASNCRRPLLFTRTACCFTYLFCWCSFVCQKTPDLSSDLPCRPCRFFVLLLVSRLAANPVHPGAPINRNPGPHARQDGICNRNTAQHHLGVRMRSR